MTQNEQKSESYAQYMTPKLSRREVLFSYHSLSTSHPLLSLLSSLGLVYSICSTVFSLSPTNRFALSRFHRFLRLLLIVDPPECRGRVIRL